MFLCKSYKPTTNLKKNKFNKTNREKNKLRSCDKLTADISAASINYKLKKVN